MPCAKPCDILITGANRGLGLAMTERLLALGYRIWVIHRHKSRRLDALQKKSPDRLFCFSADVADEKSVQRAMKAVSSRSDRIDVLINNAAVHLDPERFPIEKVDFSVYLPTFRVNTVAPLIVAKHALPMLRKGEKKLIVNISSEAGSIGAAWRKSEYAYCMSKSALNMANQILQNYLKDEGFKVLAVHPGWFTSDMGGKEAPISPEEAAKKVVDVILNPPDLSGPSFVDSDGKTMLW